MELISNPSNTHTFKDNLGEQETETDDSTTQEDQELQTEEKHCEKCNFTFVTIDHFRKHVKSNHFLGPKCWEHCLIYNQRIIYPEKCSEDPGKCCLRPSR